MLTTRPKKRKTAVQKVIRRIQSRQELRRRNSSKESVRINEVKKISLELFRFIQTHTPPFPEALSSKLDRAFCEGADKHTYRKLYLMFHPDKISETEYKQDAAEIFAKLKSLKG